MICAKNFLLDSEPTKNSSSLHTFQEHAKGRGVLSTHVVPPYSEFLFLGKEIKNSLTDSYTKLYSLTDINYPMITEDTGLPLAQKSPSFPVTGKRD